MPYERVLVHTTDGSIVEETNYVVGNPIETLVGELKKFFEPRLDPRDVAIKNQFHSIYEQEYHLDHMEQKKRKFIKDAEQEKQKNRVNFFQIFVAITIICFIKFLFF